MYVRLTKKLAEVVDGVDISACSEGDIIEVSEADAQLLIAEQWAEAVATDQVPKAVRVIKPQPAAVAADRGRAAEDHDGPPWIVRFDYRHL